MVYCLCLMGRVGQNVRREKQEAPLGPAWEEGRSRVLHLLSSPLFPCGIPLSELEHQTSQWVIHYLTPKLRSRFCQKTWNPTGATETFKDELHSLSWKNLMEHYSGQPCQCPDLGHGNGHRWGTFWEPREGSFHVWWPGDWAKKWIGYLTWVESISFQPAG